LTEACTKHRMGAEKRAYMTKSWEKIIDIIINKYNNYIVINFKINYY